MKKTINVKWYTTQSFWTIHHMQFGKARLQKKTVYVCNIIKIVTETK